MRTLGNLIWLVCGGLAMGLAWWVAGLVAFVSIVGIPWGRACFVIGELCFLPFGRSVADRRVVTGKADSPIAVRLRSVLAIPSRRLPFAGRGERKKLDAVRPAHPAATSRMPRGRQKRAAINTTTTYSVATETFRSAIESPTKIAAANAAVTIGRMKEEASSDESASVVIGTPTPASDQTYHSLAGRRSWRPFKS